MKKAMTMGVILTLILTLSSCGSESSSAGTDTTSPSISGSSVQSQTSDKTTTADESVSGTLGEYEVIIQSAELGKDENGEDVAIVTYVWTNNSDTATTFTDALYAEASQNGEECDYSYLDGDDLTMQEVQPGESLEVQEPYLLHDLTSPVTVEVYELESEETLTTTFTLSE